MEEKSEGLVVVEHELPRGGPVYPADVVGPLTRIPDFETSVLDELQTLIALLDQDQDQDQDVDLSVDELKVISEEELVGIALKEALLVQNPNPSSSQHLQNNNLPSPLQQQQQQNTPPDLVVEEAIQLQNQHVPDSSQLLLSDHQDILDKPPIHAGPNHHAHDLFENQFLQPIHPQNPAQQQEQHPVDVPDSSLNTVPTHTDEDAPGNAFVNPSEDEHAIGVPDSSSILLPTNNVDDIVETALPQPIQAENPSRKVQQIQSKRNSNKSNKRRRTPKKTTRKRGRKFDRDTRSAQLDNPHFVQKVENLAQIKRKQDQHKLAARLHSFDGSSDHKQHQLPISKPDNIRKMTSLRYTTAPGVKVKVSANVGEHVPLSYPQVLLCVEIYHCKKKWTKTQELLVLGSQMLSELRDQIYCSTDQLMQKAGESDPSGYFLIEDMFCNDKRDPSAVDYSEPIFDWLRNSKQEVQEKWECILSGELQQKQRTLFGEAPTSHLPNFKAVDMHKVRFCDLWFRLGAGYLYCHQGDCKHTIVVRDMRLIHPEDIQNRAAYPIVTFQLKNVLPKCSVCKIYRATKVTVDDKWAEENPCYFCDNCYYLLHYDENGSLLYPDFAVYDYHHM